MLLISIIYLTLDEFLELPLFIPKLCVKFLSLFALNFLTRVEEELRLLGDIVDCDGGTTRRGSTSARRSFFRRKKHHRSSSRDSKELASFSNTQLSYFSDSGMLSDEGSILSYQRVERLDRKLKAY